MIKHSFFVVLWQRLSGAGLLISCRRLVLTALERCSQRGAIIEGSRCLVMVEAGCTLRALRCAMHFLVKSYASTYVTRSNAWLLALSADVAH